MWRPDNMVGTLLTISVAVIVLAWVAAGVLLVAGHVAPLATGTQDDGSGGQNVSEERFVVPAPEEGDEYFEKRDPNGSWISYDNPRDRYRDPFIGNASGKICVSLFNEAGEVVAGESVPNTNVTIDTNDTLYWHSYADPMVVEYPLTENYERPLDADQFGTSPDLPQGDGYMDSHCIEFHGPPENKTIEYGPARIEGEHADRIKVVGYIQQANRAWDSDVDPLEDAVSYEEAGGEWTNRPNASHGQVVVVLQLQPEGEAQTGGEKDRSERQASESPTEGDGDEGGPLPQTAPGVGAGVLAALLSLAALARRRR
jgi:hypothetical protein